MITVRNSVRQNETYYNGYSGNAYTYRRNRNSYNKNVGYGYYDRRNRYGAQNGSYGRAQPVYAYRRKKGFGSTLAKGIITIGSIFGKGCKMMTNAVTNSFQSAKDIRNRHRANKKSQEDIFYSEDAAFGDISFSHDSMIKILEIPITGIMCATETSANFAKKYSNIIIDKFELEPDQEKTSKTNFNHDDLCSFDEETLAKFEKMNN